MTTTLKQDLEFFPDLESAKQTMQRRIQGTPWFAKGHGNRAAKRARHIADSQNCSGKYSKDFDRLVHGGRVGYKHDGTLPA